MLKDFGGLGSPDPSSSVVASLGTMRISLIIQLEWYFCTIREGIGGRGRMITSNPTSHRWTDGRRHWKVALEFVLVTGTVQGTV